MVVNMGEPVSAPSTSSASSKIPSNVDTSKMTEDELKLFIDTGRTGRRNALPDVTDEGIVKTSTADLPTAFDSLSFKTEGGSSSSTASSSQSNQPSTSTS